MLLLSPILILLLAALSITLLAWLRPQFKFYWLLASGATFLAWVLLWFLRIGLPRNLLLSNWTEHGILFSSLKLIVDGVSWSFALAIGTLVLAATLTDILHAMTIPWWVWSADLAIAAFGIIAVMAGNPLTLVSAWIMLDIIDLILLLLQSNDAEVRRSIIWQHIVSGLGAMVAVFALVISQTELQHLTFDNITPIVSFMLILAAGMRLGVLPLQVPFIKLKEEQRGPGTLVQLVLPAASLVLLVRTASTAVPQPVLPWMLLFTGLTSLYAAVSLFRSPDEITGRRYFLISISSLAVASALQAQPAAVNAWSMALLYSGGMLFFLSLRQRQLYPLVIAGIIGITALPKTQAVAASSMYADSFHPLMVLFLLSHSIVLLGYIRHVIWLNDPVNFSEKWFWLVYPSGLAVLPLTHYFASGILAPGMLIPAYTPWWPSLSSAILAASFFFLKRYIKTPPPELFSSLDHVLSQRWFYQILRTFYDWAVSGVRFMSGLLEGQAGVLWAFLLLALLMSLIGQTAGAPGG